MSEDGDNFLQSFDWSELVRRVRSRTPARLLTGRAGAGYRTSTQLELREAHAAARDAVRAELDIQRDLGSVVAQYKLFEVRTAATSKDEYLLRPDLGRQFSPESRARIMERCRRECQLQIALGDGLSVTALAAQAPPLLTALLEGAEQRNWSVGQIFVVRYCRVGILNEIGEFLAPQVSVLLIGERPGLATAESLSAYMAFQPKRGHTDANRNLISNIHARGVTTEQAALRILNLAALMMKMSHSGYQLREELPALRNDSV
ncbi:MAG: ethanolamine ammonia-lyase [Acidobacteria bacterium]|nr:MAG: ethanolamine ammonia-lyase [Acidobacteriota bacterium]